MSTKTPTAQQQRMVDCNKQVAGKKGADRKTSMSTCLKGGVAAMPAPRSTQQQKMTNCNADASSKALKGAQRQAFMGSCLKGDSPAAAKH